MHKNKMYITIERVAKTTQTYLVDIANVIYRAGSIEVTEKKKN